MNTLFDVPIRKTIFEVLKDVKPGKGKKRRAYKGIIKQAEPDVLPPQTSLFQDKKV